MAFAASDLPPMPPDAPQKDEVVIDGKGDAVVSRCATMAARMNKDLKLTQLTVIVTRSAKWGTIWRSDTAFPVQGPGDKPILSRTVCWKNGDLMRPLEMFDPKASIEPLRK
jgi:hypothetical protein